MHIRTQDHQKLCAKLLRVTTSRKVLYIYIYIYIYIQLELVVFEIFTLMNSQSGILTTVAAAVAVVVAVSLITGCYALPLR